MAEINESQHSSTIRRPLKAGIYAPVLTFFRAGSEDLDIPTFQNHIVRIGRAGVAPVISGTMGEAIHLSHEERIALISAARRVLDDAGMSDMPIIAGTGSGSTRETIELCKQAAEAGADYVMVIASGYFAGALSGNRKALKAFWTDVSQNSPIPVLIYNYPGASGGINLDSDLIIDLAITCPNISGVKLTCGDIGKLTRITDVMSNPDFLSTYPRKFVNAGNVIFTGWSESIMPSVFANGHGAITGLANIAPYSVVKLFELAEAARKDITILPEAQQLQGILACADYTIAKSGIAGTKFLLIMLHEYGGLPRKPLPEIEPEDAANLWAHPHTKALFKSEQKLCGGILKA